jgi:phosphoribosylamine--glycine ligase
MKVLVVGSGGREHAICWKISKSSKVDKVYCAPGNPGIKDVAECIDISPTDLDSLKDFALNNAINLTVVGPEVPLTLGIVDLFQKEGLKIFGPTKDGAMLEGSKVFSKNIMKEAGIPTADFEVFSDPDKAVSYVKNRNKPVVIKADGLAAGKGVIPCKTIDQAIDAINRILVKKEFGDAGDNIVIEDFLTGEEASFICLTDGKTISVLPSSQDHKPAYDNDEGPNTGGMGAYSPAPVLTEEVYNFTIEKVIKPLINKMAEKGIKYKGIIYAGLMIENNIPSILEFNVRLGDPEAQPILSRLKSDLFDLLYLAANEELDKYTIELDEKASVCVVMASGGYPADYKKGFKISGIEDAEKSGDIIVFHAGTAEKNGALVNNGGRVLGVTSLGNSIKEAIDIAYKGVNKISWTDVHFRTDIGKKAC